MRIIISPAKRMREDCDAIAPAGLPVFLSKTAELLLWLQSNDFDSLRKLWNCNEKIARESYEQLQTADIFKAVTPAILAYDGIQYKYMAPGVFENGMFAYVQDHVRILSGFYGVLKPMDGVVRYRLEMQAKAGVCGCRNLYEYWGDSLYREIMPDDRTVINLASKEYSECLEKYLSGNDWFITCVFGEMENGRIVQKGVYAKMARGEMVRFLAETNASSPGQLKEFDRLNYHFSPELSTETKYVFLHNLSGDGLVNLE